MRRKVIEEFLDSHVGTPREVADSLADMTMINRYMGGRRTMCRLLLRVASERRIGKLSLLDVGGGGGDLAAMTVQSLANRGLDVSPVVLDRMPSHIRAEALAEEEDGADRKSAANNCFPAVGGDALALPFKDNSFDVVGCSLLAHHLEPDEVVAFATQALRVARHAVLINDLIRHPLHLTLSYAGYPLYRSVLSRHDAVASVRRSYTVEEMHAMLRRTPAEKVEGGSFFLFRMGMIAWKKQMPVVI